MIPKYGDVMEYTGINDRWMVLRVDDGEALTVMLCLDPGEAQGFEVGTITDWTRDRDWVPVYE